MQTPMPQDVIKQWTELNKAAMTAIKELGEINSNAMAKLTQRQMDVVNLYMEGSKKQLEALSDAKGVQDVVAAQSKLFSELNQKLVENARQTVETLVDIKAELSNWAEKGMQAASANITKK